MSKFITTIISDQPNAIKITAVKDDVKVAAEEMEIVEGESRIENMYKRTFDRWLEWVKYQFEHY